MADSRVQLEVANRIRREWLPRQYKQQFLDERLLLSPGGVFDFDAVSADDKIAVNFSTSSAKKARGKHSSGKIQKLRADMVFLLIAKARSA